MGNESKKQPAVIQTRLAIPTEVHDRVVKYQARLIGRKGQKVTLADAIVALLSKATKTLK